MFAIATAFAAPLIELTGADSGGFHFRGLSSIGKTTLVRAAASVWGRGDEHGMLRTWRPTANRLEGTAALYGDTLLPLDELGVAGAREVGDIIYSLAAGIGKNSRRTNRREPMSLPGSWRWCDRPWLCEAQKSKRASHIDPPVSSTPSCGGHFATAERTLNPQGRFWRVSTTGPKLENSQGQKPTFSRAALRSRWLAARTHLAISTTGATQLSF